MIEKALSRREGRRVLVAEDNPVNRMLLERQLHELGYRVDMVENGREAVAAVEREPYDLVLMDCHMPEMDGFEAARRIRRLRRLERIPILAITATGAESEDYLAAGMDERLLKPIPQAELAAVLARHLGMELPAELAGAAQGAPRVPRTALLSDARARLRQIGERRGREALERLTRLCLEQLPPRLAELRAAVEDSAPGAVEENAHFLKGTARSLGAQELAERCHVLEEAGKSGELGAVDDALVAAEEEYVRLEEDLRAILAESEKT